MVGQFGTKFRAFALCKQVHLALAQMVIVRWAEQSSLLLVSKHGAVRPQKPYGLLGTGRSGRWYGDGGRGGVYTYRYTVTIRMTPALRWAAMRAILMFH